MKKSEKKSKIERREKGGGKRKRKTELKRKFRKK